MQAVTVRAEPRRAGTFTTRYYSSSLLLTALDGESFKSHLAQTHSLKCHVHLCSTQAGDAAALAQGTSASCHPLQPLGSASSLGSADPAAINGSGLHDNNAGEMIQGLSWLNKLEEYS